MRTIKCWNCGSIVQAAGAVGLCSNCQVEIKAKSTLAPRACRTCGAAFQGGPRAWYCPDCRRERQRKQDREAKARAKAGKVRKIGSTDICTICGKPYIVNGGLRRYCPDCAPEAIREADRVKGRQWMAEHREEQYRIKAARAEARRVCVVCGTQFYDPQPRVTCSPKCAKIWLSYNQSMADHRRRDSPAPTLRSVSDRLARLSGVPGVTRSRNGRRWIAQCRGHYIGTYDTIDQAAAAIAAWKKENPK